MKIEMTSSGSVTTIALSGRFDSSVVPEFRQMIDTLPTEQPVNYVIDLAEVQYIDSGGLGCLVAFLRRVRQAGGDIKVATLTDKVRAVFELTRLHRIFEIYDNSTAAERSFASN